VNAVRVGAVVRRHWLVLWRSPHRWFEIAFWPIMDVVLWGSLGVFIAQTDAGGLAAVPFLLSGLVLFWTLTQVQMTGSLGLMEETWTRNLLNVLTTSVTPAEYMAGVSLYGLVKLALTLITLTITTIALYGFDLTELGWAVVPISVLLILNGWAVAFLVIGCILRFVASADILTWGINYDVLALSGVFFPVEALPPAIGAISRLLPTTHVFAAVHEVLAGQPLPWEELGIAVVGTAVVMALGIWFATSMLKVFRARGFVTRYS
jgi:ABC-2 type transport system permease protein